MGTNISIHDFMSAIAGKLKTLYPTYPVYADKIGQGGYRNCFYIANIHAAMGRELHPRQNRLYRFDILFFAEEDDKMAFYDWADCMMQHFQYLQVHNNLYATKNWEVKTVDQVYYCLFEVYFHTTRTSEKISMEQLQQKGRCKK